jgi:hypothetical protein
LATKEEGGKDARNTHPDRAEYAAAPESGNAFRISRNVHRKIFCAKDWFPAPERYIVLRL